MSTVAGSGRQGNDDGPVAQASFWFPYAVAPDGQGNVYVADYGNHQAHRRITSGGAVDTPDIEVGFPYPPHIAVAADGTRYVADTYRNRILKIATDGTTVAIAGTGRPGSDDGVAAGASFRSPHGVALDAEGSLYVADSGNARIRKIAFPASMPR